MDENNSICVSTQFDSYGEDDFRKVTIELVLNEEASKAVHVWVADGCNGNLCITREGCTYAPELHAEGAYLKDNNEVMLLGRIDGEKECALSTEQLLMIKTRAYNGLWNDLNLAEKYASAYGVEMPWESEEYLAAIKDDEYFKIPDYWVIHPLPALDPEVPFEQVKKKVKELEHFKEMVEKEHAPLVVMTQEEYDKREDELKKLREKCRLGPDKKVHYPDGSFEPYIPDTVTTTGTGWPHNPYTHITCSDDQVKK